MQKLANDKQNIKRTFLAVYVRAASIHSPSETTFSLSAGHFFDMILIGAAGRRLSEKVKNNTHFIIPS